MTEGVAICPKAITRRLHQLVPPPHAMTRSNASASAGAVSVTSTVSNGQSGQNFRQSVANGPMRSAYFSHDATTTVQSEFLFISRHFYIAMKLTKSTPAADAGAPA